MDTIANYLTSIRNALKAGHKDLYIKSSSILQAITKVLKEKGYITDYQVHDVVPQKMLNIVLRYNPATQKPAITHIERVSKPSRRRYTKAQDLPHILNGLGVSILSTSKGVMTDKEARKQNIGGEELCHIY